jgi:flagellar biosynthesis protein FliR
MSLALLLQNMVGPFVYFSTYVMAFRTLSSSMGFAARSVLAIVLAIPVIGFDTQLLSNWDLLIRTLQLFATAIVSVVPSVLMVELIRMCGRLCDSLRGAQYAEQITPELGERVSLLESFGQYLAQYLFFTAGIHHIAFLIAYQGLAFFEQVKFPILPMLRISAEALERGLVLAAPLIVVGFLSDLSTMFLSRGLVKINVFFESLPLRLLSGLSVFWVVLYYRLDLALLEALHLDYLRLLESAP